MAAVERPNFDTDEENIDPAEDDHVAPAPAGSGRGAFSNNPLAKGLIRPMAREDKGKAPEREKTNTWRRVQMDADQDDNEQWILDGGVHGGQQVDVALGAEERAFG